MSSRAQDHQAVVKRWAKLMGSEPLFGALIAGLWLGEQLSVQGWIGGPLIAVATLGTLRLGRADPPANEGAATACG